MTHTVSVSTLNERATQKHTRAWASSNRRHLRISPRTADQLNRLGEACRSLLPGRLSRETWFRYRIDLSDQPSGMGNLPAQLSPVTETLIEHLSQQPLRDLPQAQTARRLWKLGLRRGFVWIEANKPLCLQWLFHPDDGPLLGRLSEWSGMYPPLPPQHGQVENILTLPAGMRYPGGAASPFTLAMLRMAADMGMRGLITHIHEKNLAAHRWAQRTGWIPYGHIHRYHCSLPLLNSWHAYVHDTNPPKLQLPMMKRQAAVSLET